MEIRQHLKSVILLSVHCTRDLRRLGDLSHIYWKLLCIFISSFIYILLLVVLTTTDLNPYYLEFGRRVLGNLWCIADGWVGTFCNASFASYMLNVMV